jgi:hypothetical protein
VEIRTVVCTTNAIESVNARLRRAVRAMSVSIRSASTLTPSAGNSGRSITPASKIMAPSHAVAKNPRDTHRIRQVVDGNREEQVTSRHPLQALSMDPRHRGAFERAAETPLHRRVGFQGHRHGEVLSEFDTTARRAHGKNHH